MTIYDILFIVLVLGVGLIVGLALISRNAFERRNQWKITIGDNSELQARRKEWAQRPLSSYYDEATLTEYKRPNGSLIRVVTSPPPSTEKPITSLVWKSFDGREISIPIEIESERQDSLSDTDAPLLPPSDTELSAIEWLSREDDWL